MILSIKFEKYLFEVVMIVIIFDMSEFIIELYFKDIKY